MASLQPYPEYTLSTTDWPGSVPVHWRLVRFGAFFDRRKLTGVLDSELLSVYRDYGVIPKNSRDDNFNKPSDDLSTYQFVEKGDLVLNKMKTWQGSIAISGYDGIVSPAYFVYKPRRRIYKTKLVPRFAHHLLRSSQYISQYLRISKGIRVNQWDLEPDEFKKIPLLLPPYKEQLTIAAFLDYETARIDRLIEKQKRLIELLQEKRQAVISHAVTKGLNPDAPMKDSGVEWLNDIPAHWERNKLSIVTDKITNGYVGPTRDVLTATGVPYLQSLHIKDNQIRFDHPYYVSKEWSNDHSKSILNEGDVLVVQTGDIGQVAHVPRQFAGANCHALIILSPRRNMLLGRYLAWTLRSSYGENSLKSIQTGALHPHLNCGYVRDIVVPIPPMREQEEIVSKLEDDLDTYRALVNKAVAANDLLREHRTALISAAVTGKIDVRDWQPPQSAGEAEERDHALLEAAEERAPYRA